MKIIKEGKLPEEKIRTGQCSKCGCVVEGRESEWDSDTYGSLGLPYLAYKCPTDGCGNNIFTHMFRTYQNAI